MNKSPELELAQQKIAELEERLKKVNAVEQGRLIPLPNGDLHRGLKLEDANKPNIDVAAVYTMEQANPLNRAMAQILLAAKGGHSLTCLWCGLQFDGQGAEKDVRTHLKTDHSSVVEGHDKVQSELLMLNLEEAKQRLAEATKKE